MYDKLLEYSNEYVNVYASKNRIIFDFKYPRLFHTEKSPNTLDISPVLSSTLNNINVQGTGISSSLNVSINPQHHPNIVYNTAVAGSIQTSNHPSSVDSANYQLNSAVHDIKTLVISSKTIFGKIYAIDSAGKIVRFYKKKLLTNSNLFCKIGKFFTQFNESISSLMITAILPKDKINTNTVNRLKTSLLLNQGYGAGNAIGLYGYLEAFQYPVLMDCKLYEYTFGDGFKRIPKSGDAIYKQMQKARSLFEFIRAVTGVKGAHFTKVMLNLCKAYETKRVWYGASALASNPELKTVEFQEKVNSSLQSGKTLTEAVSQLKDAAVIDIDEHKDYISGKNVYIKSSFETKLEDVSLLETMNGADLATDFCQFAKPFQVTDVYHLTPLIFFDKFKDLIPLDTWSEFTEIDYNPNMNYSNIPVRIEQWLKTYELPVRKKVLKAIAGSFTVFVNGTMTDIIGQLTEYNTPESIPEELRPIYPKGLQIPKDWKTIKELHDSVSIEYNRIKSFASKKTITYSNLLKRLDGIDFGGGFTSELPKDNLRIIEYGAMLKHCVANYADRCTKNNNTIIMSINKDGQPHWTLELKLAGKVSYENSEEGIKAQLPEDTDFVPYYEINQFKALHNGIPKPKDVDNILKKLFDTGVIYSIREPYGSKYGMSQPVGWEPFVEQTIWSGGGQLAIDNNGNINVNIAAGQLAGLPPGHNYVIENIAGE